MTDSTNRADELLTRATSAEARRDGTASSLRRELLAAVYVDAEADREWKPPAVVRALAEASGPDEIGELAEDLQWALERQAEVLAAQAVRWAEGEVPEGEPVDGPDLELVHRDTTIRQLEGSLGARDKQLEATARRLERATERIGVLKAELAAREEAERKRIVPGRLRHWAWRRFPGVLGRLRGARTSRP